MVAEPIRVDEEGRGNVAQFAVTGRHSPFGEGLVLGLSETRVKIGSEQWRVTSEGEEAATMGRMADKAERVPPSLRWAELKNRL